MILDEAIKHCWEKVDENVAKGCKECAGEHEQLALWLEELKEWRKLKLICANEGIVVYKHGGQVVPDALQGLRYEESPSEVKAHDTCPCGREDE